MHVVLRYCIDGHTTQKLVIKFTEEPEVLASFQGQLCNQC